MSIIQYIKNQKKIIIVILVMLSSVIMLRIVSGIVINMSNSVPRGLYLLYPKYNIKKGDIINFKIPRELKLLALKRNYIVKNTNSLTKYVIASEGDVILRKNNLILVNNIAVGNIYLTDSKNRVLNSVFINNQEVALKKNEYFTMGLTDDSLDSRYYGIIKREDIFKKSILILKFKNNIN